MPSSFDCRRGSQCPPAKSESSPTSITHVFAALALYICNPYLQISHRTQRQTVIRQKIRQLSKIPERHASPKQDTTNPGQFMLVHTAIPGAVLPTPRPIYVLRRPTSRPRFNNATRQTIEDSGRSCCACSANNCQPDRFLKLCLLRRLRYAPPRLRMARQKSRTSLSW